MSDEDSHLKIAKSCGKEHAFDPENDICMGCGNWLCKNACDYIVMENGTKSGLLKGTCMVSNVFHPVDAKYCIECALKKSETENPELAFFFDPKKLENAFCVMLKHVPEEKKKVVEKALGALVSEKVRRQKEKEEEEEEERKESNVNEKFDEIEESKKGSKKRKRKPEDIKSEMESLMEKEWNLKDKLKSLKKKRKILRDECSHKGSVQEVTVEMFGGRENVEWTCTACYEKLDYGDFGGDAYIVQRILHKLEETDDFSV